MSLRSLRPRQLSLVATAILVAACATADAPSAPATPGALQRSQSAAPTTVGAIMRFGRPDMNAFAHMSPAAMQHAQAGHPVDKVYPGSVVIDRGQTVAFESFPVHQIAVYAPGTKPSDIRLTPEFLADAETPWGTFADVLIDDPANRLALSPVSFERMTWMPDAATFSQPGRYLVICTLVFHFVPTKMYGWVEVR